MTYRLHNRLGSGGFVIQATLAAAEIEFEYAPFASKPNEPLGERVHDLNGWGQLPVLELPDGARLTEVAAILAHLSTAEPALGRGPHLWIDDHPQFLRWAVFLSVNIYEGILRRSYTKRFFGDVAQLARGRLSDPPEAIEALITDAVRQAAKERVHAAFRYIEQDTSDHAFLLSDRMSPCDVFLAMLYAWHTPQTDLPKCTWITTQVATHDLIRPIWAQNFHDRMKLKWHEL